MKKMNRIKREKWGIFESRAAKRLMRDYKELMKKENRLPYVNAKPCQKNIFKWHGNIKGVENTPYHGGIFHFEMHFSENYPEVSPEIVLSTNIKHPNVFDKVVCLDICTPRPKKRNQNDFFYGWSSAYSVFSICSQLQSFLSEGNVGRILADIRDPSLYEKKKKEWVSSINWSVEQSLLYKDSSIGHNPPNSPFPLFIIQEEKQEEEKQEEKNSPICFYTKKSITECCLGIGINFRKTVSNELKWISSTLELFSLDAFMNQKLRKSELNKEFTHFLPVFINKEHGKKSIHLLKRSLSIIVSGNHNKFIPKMVLIVFPKLISQLVVDMASKKDYQPLYYLQGICWVHRIMLEFLKEYPSLQEEIDFEIKSFIQSEKKRNKTKTPSIFDFLSVFLFSSNKEYEWKTIEQNLIEELFARQCNEIFQHYPELESFNNTDFGDKERIQYSFKIICKYLKLLPFYKYLFENITNPKRKSRYELCNKYDQDFGRIGFLESEKFLNFANQVQDARSFFAIFDLLDHQITENQIIDLLKQAVDNSKKKKYHGEKLPVVTLLKYTQSQEIDWKTVVESYDETTKVYTFKNDPVVFKKICFEKWGIDTLPDYLKKEGTKEACIESPWRKLFLQLNLQEFINKFNDLCDFKKLYKLLQLSQEIRNLEITIFKPTKIKSNFHFLTIILKTLKNLVSLKIKKGNSSLTSNGIKCLMKGLMHSSGKLEVLNLEYCGLNAESIESLVKNDFQLGGNKQNSNLTVFSLKGNPIGDQGAEHLAKFLLIHSNFPKLQILDLSDCSIKNTGGSAISEVFLTKKNIEVFKIHNNNINLSSSKILCNLSYSRKIKEIDFSRQGKLVLFEDGKNNLEKLLKLTISLEKLCFWKTEITNLHKSVFKGLRNNCTLKELDLASTKFGETNGEYLLGSLGYSLSKNQTLQKLNLANNKLTVSKLSKFLEEVKKPPRKTKGNDNDHEDYVPQLSLIELDLSRNNFAFCESEKEENIFGTLLKYSKKLKILNLENCNIKEKFISNSKFSKYLSSHNSLEILNLKKNGIGKRGLKLAIDGFSKNQSLKKLDLSGNKLEVIGGKGVAMILKKNRSLEFLNLYNNKIKSEGIIEIAKSIKANKDIKLKELDLGMNKISRIGGTKINELIQSNESLEKISMKKCGLKDSQLISFVDSILHHKESKIKNVQVSKNQISKETIILCFQKIQNSKTHRELEIDVNKYIKKKDSKKLNNTVYLSPLPKSIKEEQIKQFFYQNKCGVILEVAILEHKKFLDNKKVKYAFVLFESQNSVLRALQLQRERKNDLLGQFFRIEKAGIINNLFLKKKRRIPKQRKELEEEIFVRQTQLDYFRNKKVQDRFDQGIITPLPKEMKNQISPHKDGIIKFEKDLIEEEVLAEWGDDVIVEEWGDVNEENPPELVVKEDWTSDPVPDQDWASQ